MADNSDVRNVAASLTSKLLTDPGVLAAFSRELNSMVGRSSGYIESLPKPVKRRIRALKKMQVELFKLESSFYAEVHELECKYAALYSPLYEKRQEIINAVSEPTDVECEWDSDCGDSEDIETGKTNGNHERFIADTPNSHEEHLDADGEHMKGIPEFWLTVLKNISEFSELIKEHDEEILKSLSDIRVNQRSAPEMGFQVEFLFLPNDYFSNEVLTKSYFLRYLPNPDKPLVYDGPEIIRCEGCVIDWKPGKNVTEKKIKEKQNCPGSGRKFVTKIIKVDSFFNIFSPPPGSKDEVEDEEIRSQLMADFELGHMLQERIVPRAVLYFTGEAIDHTPESEYSDETEDDGNDEEAEDKDGSDEEHDPDYVPPKNMKDGPPDCRQQ